MRTLAGVFGGPNSVRRPGRVNNCLSTRTSRRRKSTRIAHRQRRGSAGGRPPHFDATTYKDRNVVERSFNDYKQWRGLATRYDKLATTYRGGVVLRALLIWLRQ